LISKKANYIDVEVERTKESMVTLIRGSITNMENAPVQNALVNFDSGLATGYTDQNGDFSFTVPKPAGEKVKLKVLVDGLVKYDEQITLSSSIPINLKL
jgi:bacillopeptidase F (M6 metalloprotease family)